jgi:DNA-directed RNA polymerase specialized sigma24 family protein
VAWNFVAMADPAFWTEHFAGVNFARAPAADFTLDGRTYGVFAHEWRIEPPADWMLAIRSPMPFAGDTSAVSTSRLSREQFQDAVRAALRDYTRPEKLATNPLCATRLTSGDSARIAKAAALQSKLREAAQALQSNPKDLKLYRALWRTYFEPLATQELVAERLGLPFSTYRHHLSRGVESVAAWLWQHERASPPG